MKRLIGVWMVLAACGGGDNSRQCKDSSECLLGGESGFCLPSTESNAMWCAYASADCPSGNRWGVAAGDGLARECVAEAGPGDKVKLAVAISGDGNGKITSQPEGIDCPGTCEADFGTGTTVVLTAEAESDSALVEWSGACSGRGTCSVSLGTSAASVDARLELRGSTLAAVLIEGPGQDYPMGLALDGDDDVVYGGIVGAEYMGAFGALFLGKIGLFGAAPSWQRVFGNGTDFESGSGIEAVALGKDGSIIVAGRIYHVIIDGMVLDGEDGSLFVASFNGRGTLEWVRQVDAAVTFFPLNKLGLGVGSDDAIYVATPLSGSLSFAGDTIVGTSRDTAVLKFDAAGNPVRAILLGGGEGNVRTKALAVDASDNVYVAGDFNGTVGFGGSDFKTAKGQDAFVFKLNSDLIQTWLQTFSPEDPESEETIDSIVSDADGRTYVLGAFETTINVGGLGLSSAGGDDVFVASFEANGTHRWSKSTGSPMSETGSTLCVGPGGSLVLAGQTEQPFQFEDFEINHSGTFLFSLQTNLGKVEWSRVLHGGEEGSVELFAMQCSAGGVIMGGTVFGDVPFGSTTLSGSSRAILHTVLP